MSTFWLGVKRRTYLGLTSTKIGKDLQTYAKLQGFGKVDNKVKGIGNKTSQVWRCVKRIVEVDDE